MSKETAVQWLIDYVNSDLYQKSFGQTYISVELVQQALDIEKLQIIKAYRDGRTDERSNNRTSLQYYNETYKGGTNE